MKRHLIRKYFNSAVNRLSRSLGSLPSVYEGKFNYILRFLDYEDFDKYHVAEAIKQFSSVLEDMSCWLHEIFPDNPTYKDKQYLKRCDKVIEFAEERLEKIKKLIPENK